MKFRVSVLAGLVSTALLSACSSDNQSVPGSNTNGTGAVDATGRKLQTLDNSEAFLSALRAGLIARSGPQNIYAFPESGTDATGSGAVPPANAPMPTAGAEDNAVSDSGSAGNGAAGNEVTSTNVQEQGVDEQDWVKLSADGNRLYVLDSAYPEYGYPVLEGPAVDIPAVGAPDDTSIVAPQSYQTTLRIMQLNVDAPDASSLNDLPLSLDGRYAEGFYLYENAGQSNAVVTASGNNYWTYWADSIAFRGVDSRIARVNVTDAANASVTASMTLDGQIISSRRIGKYLFFASRFYPSLPGVQPYELSQEQWKQVVTDADAADLLPQYSMNGSGAPSPLIDPAGCFVSPSTNKPDYYYSPDIITLAVLDLDTFQLSDSECYLGASETLYASPEAVFLATTQYDYTAGPVAVDGQRVDVDVIDFPPDIIWYDPRVDTDIHQFDIEAGQLVYAGTGTVDGHLGWNDLRKPFRMSEKDGYLRVATVNDRQGFGESPILMTVLQADGTGTLKTISSLPNSSQPGFIGKPGEQLYASRFLGDRAYLVTFRQTDPLYVIDLSNPAQPVVAGELEIEGYSDYLHPIDENYLLGIGKDAVAAPDNVGDGRGALVQGIKLSLFEISDPASPREVQSLLVGQRGTDARALNDHRAITVQAATDEHPTRVSFGIDVYGEASPASSPSVDAAFAHSLWNYSGLHGFDIRTGSDAGITSRGALVVARASDNPNVYSYPYYANDRSVMVNDSLFYIRGFNVYAAPWDDLASPTPAR